MILHEELKRFGLSQSESKAYTTLLGLKEARASEIAKLSKVPRNKIYSIMESLHKKGFVEIIPEKVLRYRAVPFDSAFMLLLEENEKRASEMRKAGEKIANQLKNVRLEKNDTGEFTVYKSKKVIYKKLEEILQAAKERIFLCLEAQDLRQLYFLSKSMPTELNVITKIDSETKATAKKWSFANMRHAELPPAKIAVIDNEAFVFQTNSPIALHSTDQSFVALIKNFAEMLWDLSVPAKEKIAEIETGKPVEELRYIHGRGNIYNLLPELFRHAKHDVIVATTANGAIRTYKYLKDVIHEAKQRGVRTKCLTTIKKSNLEALKNLDVETRHLEKPRAVLSCFDNSQLLLIQLRDDTPTLDSPEDVAILTNQKATVSTFRFILETVWEQAKPLETRIREIETGKPAEEIKFIREEDPIYEITKELSSKATKEICNISTEASLERAVKFNTLDIDADRAKAGVKVRYIYPITKNNLELVKKVMQFAEIRHTDSPPMRVRIIDDDKCCLLRHGEEEFLEEKFCICSHAKDFVSAMKLFFEKMWSQAVPAEERIRQLESEIEIEEARKIINQYKEMFPQEPYL